MKAKQPKGLPYHGGKPHHRPTGKWIASMLPWEYNSTYCEPFAGMLGVLFGRPPVINEIVNDLDGNIINWWRVIQTQPDELARLIALTPHSRELFKQAQSILLDGENHSALERAHAIYIVIQQSLLRAVDSGFVLSYAPVRVRQWTGDEIAPLVERLRHVQIENRDALEVLERIGLCEDAVVYCDPPYAGTLSNIYGTGKDGVDRGLMLELLKAQKGRVAISGYGDEWDDLGWEKHEFLKHHNTIQKRVGRIHSTRMEILWCNYDAKAVKRQSELLL